VSKECNIYLKNKCLPQTHERHRGSHKLMRWLSAYEMIGKKYFSGFAKDYFLNMNADRPFSLLLQEHSQQKLCCKNAFF